MKDIGFVSSGDGSQLATYQDFKAYLDEEIYLYDIDRTDLHQFRCVVIPDHSHRGLLLQHARKFNDYLLKGGFLIVFEPNRCDQWLDGSLGMQWFDRPTDDWKWWLKPGGRVEIYQPEPLHPIAKMISLPDMSWHYFGAYRLPQGATPILNLDGDEGCVFYDQAVPGGGRLLATTLDPHFHNGHRFMPATTRFLKLFYPWLKAEVQRHAH